MTLLWILLGIVAGVALMVVIGERFGRPVGSARQLQLSKWIVILIVVALVARIIQHYFGA